MNRCQNDEYHGEGKMDKTKLQILIVDDMKTMRLMVKSSLKKLGFENFYEAADGVEATQVLAKKPINFIISDWNMPEMTGLELLQKCRSSNRYQTIPFIMLTAEQDTHQVREAVESGVDSYIIKPFSHEIFKERLDAVLKAKV